MAPEEGIVFNGDTLSGPMPGPFGPEEGDVFDGKSTPPDGVSSGSGGLGLGFGTIFPPNPAPVVGVDGGGPLVLTAIPTTSAAFMPYNQYNAASGGIPPYTWELIGGAYPDGTGPLIFSVTGNIDQIYGEHLLQTGPFSYTLQVTDSSGVVSAAPTTQGTYVGTITQQGSMPPTTADNQLYMIVCVTSNESPTSTVAEVTGVHINNNALIFTRVFHDASFTYSDPTANPSDPVATVSVDIFTCPVPKKMDATAGWTLQGNGVAAHGTIMMFIINGLADINNPFDSAFPNVAMNTTGTASAPTNTITTSAPAEFLFGLTINHTLGGGEAAPAPDPNGWVPIPGSTIDNHGSGPGGFWLTATNKEAPTVLNNVTVTAGFTDSFWYQVILAFKGTPGGTQQTARATITGNVTPVVPGTATIEGPIGSVLGDHYFIVPPYNTLMIEMFAGTDGETTIASTFGARYNSGGSEHTVILNHSDFGAPPSGGPIAYVIPGGSPPGHIVFTWI